MPDERRKRIELVLLPGLDGTGLLFEPLRECLPPGIIPRLVAYPPDQCLGYAELLGVVMEALPKSGPFVLLGESFSGPVAVMAAARHPAGLRGLVLCATFIRNPIPLLPRWARAFVRPLAFRLFPVAAQFKLLLGGYSTAKLQSLLAKAHSLVSPSVLAARVRAVLDGDVAAELRACDVPILYIRGGADHLVPRGNLHAIAEIKSDVRSVMIPAPHPILQTRPAEAARAIAAFVGSLGDS